MRCGPAEHLRNLRTNKFFTKAHVLSKTMLTLIQQIQFYTCHMVLEPNWTAMYNKLKQAKTVEDVLRDHTAFLDDSLRDSLLSENKLTRLLTKLMSICEIYCTFLSRSMSMFYSQSSIHFPTPISPPTRCILPLSSVPLNCNTF